MLYRGLVGSLLVCLGGLVVSALPSSSPLLQVVPMQVLRTTMWGRMSALVLVMAGLWLLAGAWLRLMRVLAVKADTTEQTATAVGTARLAAGMWSLPLLVAPPLFSRDGWSYAATGVMLKVGISPYDAGPAVLVPHPVTQAVDPRWMDTPTPYGPLALIWGAAAAHLTLDPYLLVILHRVAALIGLALLLWALPRLASWTGVNPAFATALVVASPMMMANGVGGLHNDLLMVGLMAAALVAAVERGWLVGAVLGGLAAAVKLPGGIVCVGVALVTLGVGATMTQRVRRLAACAAVAFGVVIGLGLVAGVGVGWVNGLGVPGSVVTPLSLVGMLGKALDVVATWLGATSGIVARVVQVLGTLTGLGIATWVALRWPSGERVGAVRAVAISVSAVMLLAPVVQLWYFLWPLPFVAVLATRRITVGATMVLVAVLGLAAPLDPSLHGVYVLIAYPILAIVLVLVLLFLTPSARQRMEHTLAGIAYAGEEEQPAK
ncbi:MAG: polyprenol phosphomannose-dependent alpha 1,6 mannosyltransferase MptB [Nocardioides sp.]|nr:polyprenol phosphomannose-dependent alpha 1,6 mannosyltransferase MptB [Nocardioides sp.]